MRFSRSLFASLSLLLGAVTVCMITPRYVAAQDGMATTIPSVVDPRTKDIQKQLQGYYDEMGAGFAIYDVNIATKYFAKDYRSVGKDNKKETLAQMKALYKMVLSRALSSGMKTEITICTVKGDTATVQTRMKLFARVRSDDGVESVFEGDDMARDFWMKRKGVWQIKQSRDFDFNITLNGQKFAE